jgi:hypothetical protein
VSRLGKGNRGDRDLFCRIFAAAPNAIGVLAKGAHRSF